MSAMLRVEPLTESSGVIYLGDEISEPVSERVLAAAAALREHLGPALIDLIPAYSSVHFTIDPLQIRITHCCQLLQQALAQTLQQAAENSAATAARVHHIPVYYHPEVGPDFKQVMAAAGLGMAELVALHSRRAYRVYAIGFAPGFCFLGNLDPRLQLPRRAQPRQRVAAGSVAIAESQTAVYPCETPGGWHLIGRSPIDMLTLCEDRSSGIVVGDSIKFEAIDRNTFIELGGDLTPLEAGR